MILVDYIRSIFPSMYWSAGFIAFAVVAIGVSALMFAFTRWNGWIMTALAAGLYLLPFFITMR